MKHEERLEQFTDELRKLGYQELMTAHSGGLRCEVYQARARALPDVAILVAHGGHEVFTATAMTNTMEQDLAEIKAVGARNRATEKQADSGKKEGQ